MQWWDTSSDRGGVGNFVQLRHEALALQHQRLQRCIVLLHSCQDLASFLQLSLLSALSP